jgi:hypothetical protein
LIAWAVTTLAILDNPGPQVQKYRTKKRLGETLGWLCQFREPLDEKRPMLPVEVTFPLP